MRLTLGFRAAVGVLVSSIIASGCSQSPTAPSQSQAAASPTSSSAEPIVMAQAGGSVDSKTSKPAAGTAGRRLSIPFGSRAAIRTSSIRCCFPVRRHPRTGPPQSRCSCLKTVHSSVPAC